jgi:2-iminobutanoate/2-iminopropanoate deaminase
MTKKTVVPVPIADAVDAHGRKVSPNSRCIKANGFLFISGIPPHDPATGDIVRGDIETQSRRVLDNLRITLEAAGSSLDNVVMTHVFCTTVAWFGTINAIYREYFQTAPPARTFVTVGSWANPLDIEIEAIAVA